MKKQALLIIPAICLLLMAAPARAYQNEINFALETGCGTYTVGSVEADALESSMYLSYSRYFTPVATTDTPFGERVFLQHPSELHVELAATVEDVEYSNLSLTKGNSAFALGGKYYLPTNTGLGLRLASVYAEQERTLNWLTLSKSEAYGAMVTFSVDQYVADSVNIAARYEMLRATLDDKVALTSSDINSDVMEIEARALINRMFVVDVMLGGGTQKTEAAAGIEDSDVSRFGFEIAVYPAQKVKVFIKGGAERQERTAYENTASRAYIGGDIYFSDQSHLEASFGSLHEEVIDAGSKTETEIGLLRFLFGYMF